MDGALTYFPSTTPPPLEKVERFIAGQLAHWEQYGYGNWGIQPINEFEIIGWAGLQYLPELDETEVGFLLSPPNWGQGYATEAGAPRSNSDLNGLTSITSSRWCIPKISPRGASSRNAE
jgi:RimJ/RimL family protein N-acetyltransferase